MGWIVLHRFTGHGYATEAGRKLFRYMMEEYGIKQMIALVKHANMVSIKVAERIGFVESGLWRDHIRRWLSKDSFCARGNERDRFQYCDQFLCRRRGRRESQEDAEPRGKC